MAEQRYNGWANYATWGVALVLDNDEGTYNYVKDLARQLQDEIESGHPNVPEIWTAERALRFELADRLKDFTEELCGLEGEELGIPEPSLMAKQVLQAGLADVDWDEIAEHYVSK